MRSTNLKESNRIIVDILTHLWINVYKQENLDRDILKRCRNEVQKILHSEFWIELSEVNMLTTAKIQTVRKAVINLIDKQQILEWKPSGIIDRGTKKIKKMLWKLNEDTPISWVPLDQLIGYISTLSSAVFRPLIQKIKEDIRDYTNINQDNILFEDESQVAYEIFSTLRYNGVMWAKDLGEVIWYGAYDYFFENHIMHEWYEMYNKIMSNLYVTYLYYLKNVDLARDMREIKHPTEKHGRMKHLVWSDPIEWIPEDISHDIHTQSAEKNRSIIELISNALDAGENEPVKVETHDGRYIVTDSGSGISEIWIFEKLLLPKMSGKSSEDGIGRFWVGFLTALAHLQRWSDSVIVNTTTQENQWHQIVFKIDEVSGDIFVWFANIHDNQGKWTSICIQSEGIQKTAINELVMHYFQYGEAAKRIELNGVKISENCELVDITRGISISKEIKDTGVAQITLNWVTIETIELRGANVPANIVINFPPTCHIPESRSELIIDKWVQEILIRYISRISQAKGLQKREKVAIFNALAEIIREFQKRIPSSSMGKNPLRFLQNSFGKCELANCIVMPNHPDYHLINIPDAILLDPDISTLDPQCITEMELAEEWSWANGESFFIVPFKDNTRSFFIHQNNVFINSGVYERYKNNPEIFSTLFSWLDKTWITSATQAIWHHTAHWIQSKNNNKPVSNRNVKETSTKMNVVENNPQAKKMLDLFMHGSYNIRIRENWKNKLEKYAQWNWETQIEVIRDEMFEIFKFMQQDTHHYNSEQESEDGMATMWQYYTNIDLEDFERLWVMISEVISNPDIWTWKTEYEKRFYAEFSRHKGLEWMQDYDCSDHLFPTYSTGQWIFIQSIYWFRSTISHFATMEWIDDFHTFFNDEYRAIICKEFWLDNVHKPHSSFVLDMDDFNEPLQVQNRFSYMLVSLLSHLNAYNISIKDFIQDVREFDTLSSWRIVETLLTLRHNTFYENEKNIPTERILLLIKILSSLPERQLSLLLPIWQIRKSGIIKQLLDYTKELRDTSKNWNSNENSVLVSIPREMRKYVLFLLEWGEPLQEKEQGELCRNSDGKSIEYELAALSTLRKQKYSQYSSISTLQDLWKLVEWTSKDNDITRSLREIGHCIQSQSANDPYLWVREMIQNSMDAITSHKIDDHKKIYIRSFTVREHLVQEINDPAWMSLNTVLNYLLIPNISSKGDDSETIWEKWQWFFTILNGADFVSIKTSKWDGLVTYVDIQTMEEESIWRDFTITISQKKEDFKGTTIQRWLIAEIPEFEAAAFKSATISHGHLIDTNDIEIIYSGSAINKSKHLVWSTDNDLWTFKAYRSEKCSLTQRWFYIKEIESWFMNTLPKAMKESLARDPISFDIPSNIRLIKSRDDIAKKNDLMPAINDAVMQLIFLTFIKRISEGEEEAYISWLSYDMCNADMYHMLQNSRTKKDALRIQFWEPVRNFEDYLHDDVQVMELALQIPYITYGKEKVSVFDIMTRYHTHEWEVFLDELPEWLSKRFKHAEQEKIWKKLVRENQESEVKDFMLQKNQENTQYGIFLKIVSYIMSHIPEIVWRKVLIGYYCSKESSWAHANRSLVWYNLEYWDDTIQNLLVIWENGVKLKTPEEIESELKRIILTTTHECVHIAEKSLWWTHGAKFFETQRQYLEELFAQEDFDILWFIRKLAEETWNIESITWEQLIKTHKSRSLLVS